MSPMLQLQPHPHTPPSPSAIDANLLSDPTQIAALETLQSLVPSESGDHKPTTTLSFLTATTSARLHPINQHLEFQIDKFTDNVHTLGAYKSAAETLADDVLGLCADALEQREKVGKERANEKAGGDEEVGIRDVLRGLSRVIDR